MDGCTTYKLSYWPCSEKRRPPIILQETENVLNAGCCSDNNTTYRLSYFGCGGDKRDLIRQPDNILPSPCPPAYDTINRVRNQKNIHILSFPNFISGRRTWPSMTCLLRSMAHTVAANERFPPEVHCEVTALISQWCHRLFGLCDTGMHRTTHVQWILASAW